MKENTFNNICNYLLLVLAIVGTITFTLGSYLLIITIIREIIK